MVGAPFIFQALSFPLFLLPTLFFLPSPWKMHIKHLAWGNLLSQSLFYSLVTLWLHRDNVKILGNLLRITTVSSSLVVTGLLT